MKKPRRVFAFLLLLVAAFWLISFSFKNASAPPDIEKARSAVGPARAERQAVSSGTKSSVMQNDAVIQSAEPASTNDLRAIQAHAELVPIINDVIGWLEKGDVTEAMWGHASPSAQSRRPPTYPVEDLSPEQQAQQKVWQEEGRQAALRDPTYQSRLIALRAIQNAIPSLNDTGDVATYTLDPELSALVWAKLEEGRTVDPPGFIRTRPLPPPVAPGTPYHILFHKVNGQWYVNGAG